MCVVTASNVWRPRWGKDRSQFHSFIKYSRSRNQIGPLVERHPFFQQKLLLSQSRRVWMFLACVSSTRFELGPAGSRHGLECIDGAPGANKEFQFTQRLARQARYVGCLGRSATPSPPSRSLPDGPPAGSEDQS